MDHPVVAAVANHHNVSAAVVMLKYVSTHGIVVISSFNKLQHGVEDMGIFDFELSTEDFQQLSALQTGKRTCPGCFTDDCQKCAQALLDQQCAVGDMLAAGRGIPWSAQCLECATRVKTIVITTCKAQYMIEKACGQAGGFPCVRED